MKLVCICIVATLAVLQLAGHALAVSTSAVNVTASTTARDIKDLFDGNSLVVLTINDTAEDFSPSGGHIQATATAPNTIGESSAVGEAKANAQIGHLGVSV